MRCMHLSFEVGFRPLVLAVVISFVSFFSDFEEITKTINYFVIKFKSSKKIRKRRIGKTYLIKETFGSSMCFQHLG